MNPFGLIIIALGLILIIIGFKGSQHNVVTSLGGAKSQADQAEQNAPTATSAGSASTDNTTAGNAGG